ncbi:MAG: hypothetical protein K2L96_02685 [Muribaculaceae bacterium]|nr:hypothetical protein [Muribaculaceae bacterium]
MSAEADKLKKTVSGLASKLGNAASLAMNGGDVKPEASMVISILENTPVEAKSISNNKLYLKVPATDTVPEAWFVLVDMNKERIKFTTAIKADIAEKFKAAGFEAVYKYPLTMVSEEKAMKDIAGTKMLKKLITDMVARQENVIAEFAKTDAYAKKMLDVMVFDREHVAKGMERSKYFSKIDEDGDVKLEIPATNDCMYERFVWVLPKVDRVTLDCGILGVSFPENIESIAKELETEVMGVKFKVNNEGKLRLKAYVDPEDYPAEDIPEHIFKTIDLKIIKLIDTWAKVLKKMDVRVSANQFFDLPLVREKLKGMPHFDKMDNDGDIRFRVPGDQNFQPLRFVWVMMVKDRVTIDANISGYASFGASVSPEEVVAKFNDANLGFEAYVSNDIVRVRKRFRLANYPTSNPTEKVIEDVKSEFVKALDAVARAASIAGIKTKYYRPKLGALEGVLNKDLFGGVSVDGQEMTIRLKPTKTTDGDLLSTGMLTIKNSDSTTKFELKVQLEKSCNKDNVHGLAQQNASSLAKIVHQQVDYESGNYSTRVWFSVPHYTFDSEKDFISVFLEAMETLIEIDSKASDMVLVAYNQEIREKREQERRRQEEERERERRRQEEERERVRRRAAEIDAIRERELNSGFNYTLRSGGTIRALQEGFTEDYPYLRIGVYMVKTGQQADRSGGTITSYNSATTFGEIRSFKGECRVRIEGRSTPKSLEKEFRDKSGLVIKICYNDKNDERIYISKDSMYYDMPICDINSSLRSSGCYKADIS